MAGQAGDMAGQAGDMAGQAGGMGGGAGVVETFDDHRGYGTIRRLDDGAELFFHCTAIADGSRSIAVGQPVRFHTAPGHLGRTEARGIEKA